MDLKRSEEKTITITEECPECGGTGVYVGFCERDGAGVVCAKCRGSGSFVFRHAYREFAGRRVRADVKRVYEANCGIGIGCGRDSEGNVLRLEDFGGMPYRSWVEGKPFPEGSEMRRFTCPRLWLQAIGEFNLDCCAYVGPVRHCSAYAHKELCWDRYDHGERREEPNA